MDTMIQRGEGGMSAVAQAADALLAQCARFVECVSEPAYTTCSQVLRGGTFGKHVRHVLDHYSAIFLAIETGEPISYDRRERNVPMEVNRGAAIDAIADLRRRLADLGTRELGGPVGVCVMLTGDGNEAELNSTVAREVAFATHHAVHHHAMMKAIAQEFGCEVGQDVGKAPSTIKFESGKK